MPSSPATPYAKDVIVMNTYVQGLTDAYPIGPFINSTFFSLQSFAVQDASGVMVNNVTALTILGTTIIYLLPPRSIDFTFSLDDGNITLIFDQEVFANTFDDAKLTTQNHMTAPNVNYTYQNGAPINLQPTVINLFPDEVEINGLKAVPYLALSIYTTFISLAEGLIRDAVGYPWFAIPQNALPEDSYVSDQGRPSLRAFTVYFNSGRLITLFFSYSAQADSLQLEQFILQNSTSSPTFKFNISNATPINDNIVT